MVVRALQDGIRRVSDAGFAAVARPVRSVATYLGSQIRRGAFSTLVVRRSGCTSVVSSIEVKRDANSACDGVYVAIIEIERFAFLQQRVGYALASQLVVTLTERLTLALDVRDIGRVSRTSIEFSFAADCSAEASDALHRFVDLMERPVELQGQSFYLSVTIGAAVASGAGLTDDTLDRAGAAVAVAREQRLKLFVAGKSVEPTNGLDYVSLMSELPNAMENGEVSLYYQPKLTARTNCYGSCEALLRWHHPVHGLLRTDKLIEFAEATGAIRAVTYWVVEQAIADQKKLAASGFDLTFFVNISGVMLPEQAFAERALALVAGACGEIGFEITETAVIEDPADAIVNLQAFADAGIKIAIDDYGSGLSSLAYLKRLPAHELKIDRMFVSGLTDSHRDPLIVRSTIDLAHALEMQVTAEGVEDAMSLALLRVMGCDLIQGHVVSPALPLRTLDLFLKKHEKQGLNEFSRFDPRDWRHRSVG